MGEVRIFGIRHHGPGSARSLVRALEEFSPDVLLVEGPEEAEAVVPLLLEEGMAPPVAILLYAKDDARKAFYYPLAEFSPEWQTFRYGLDRNIPIRMMDLPASITLATMDEEDEGDEQEEVRHDPLRIAAEAAGYGDSERWWEDMVERRQNAQEIFEAVLELMTALRSDFKLPETKHDKRREAHMRTCLRAASREFEKVAVVCGAWHGPALMEKVAAGEDAASLKGLAKVKTEATWVPWTYELLSSHSGYGAGVLSPAYYEHLWKAGPERASEQWLIHTARMLRDEDLEASPASTIEALRLAEALAAVRERPLPGLPELRDAALSVLCNGRPEPMRLVERKLIFGERMGEVPESVPLVPLHADLIATQKRLRMKPEVAQKKIDLDLRTDMDLQRSHMLHRLGILGIHWGTKQVGFSRQSTFHEFWTLEWNPAMVIELIRASRWGTTLMGAATEFAVQKAEGLASLQKLSDLTAEVLLADLVDSVEGVTLALQNLAALSSDAGELLDALPSLGNILRYGNVRRTDASGVRQVFDSIFTRALIALPGACVNLDDESALKLAERISAMATVVRLLERPELDEAWADVLLLLSGNDDLHGQVNGKVLRLLLDMQRIGSEAVALRFSRLSSVGSAPGQTAAWIEGFLSGSGMLLIHDDELLGLIDGWVGGLEQSSFETVLPLVRRTFSTFPPAERRQIGEKVRSGKTGGGSVVGDEDFDEELVAFVTPVLKLILGDVIDV